MAVTTFAAIDIGSYNVSVEIFELNKKTGLRSLSRMRRSLELGKDTFALKKITTERLFELTRILTDYRRLMKEFGVSEYRACAKSAFREAVNKDLVVNHIYRATGIRIDILANAEQRFLGYKSIASRGEEFQKFIKKGTAIIDVGGGSTQISVFDKDALVMTQNLPLGSLRVRERLSGVAKDTVHYDRLVEALIRKDITDFRKMYLKNRKIENIILVGDYFTNLIFQNTDDEDQTESRAEFMKWYDHVVTGSPKAVAEELGISAEVSTVLIPMAVLYRTLIDELSVETVWLPGIQLTDGIAYDYAERKRFIKPSHNFNRDIVMAAKNISKRYGGNRAHCEVLADASAAIFGALRKYAIFTDREELLLRVACYLCDCGKYISQTSEAECSYNIIMATEIIGLSERERRIIAGTVLHHASKAGYYGGDDYLSGLETEDDMLVAQLAAIMRIASCLDQSRLQKMQELTAARKDDELVISVRAEGDFTLEMGMFYENAGFFEEIFNLKPILKMKKMKG